MLEPHLKDAKSHLRSISTDRNLAFTDLKPFNLFLERKDAITRTWASSQCSQGHVIKASVDKGRIFLLLQC